MDRETRLCADILGPRKKLSLNPSALGLADRQTLLDGPNEIMTSDLDIYRSANELIKQFGDAADIEAAIHRLR